MVWWWWTSLGFFCLGNSLSVLQFLSKRYRVWGSVRPDVACLIGIRKLWSMSQDQPFIWKSHSSQFVCVCRLSATESHGISRVWQTLLTMLIKSQIWHPASSVVLCGEDSANGHGLCPPFCLRETCLQLLPWCQTLHYLPVCHWYLSNCYPSAGAQREWVWVSPCVDSLRGTAWDSRNFRHQLNPP